MHRSRLHAPGRTLPPGALCESDRDVCALEECDGMGECKATGAVEACATQSLNNPCWMWQCNKKSGCQQAAFLEGVSCDDVNGCTISATCEATDLGGKLCIGTPLDVDDGHPCTDDKCAGGAVDHVALSGSVCDADCHLALCDHGTCSCQDGPPTGTPCNGTGWHYCTATCADDSLPMAQCLAGKLGDSGCHDFAYTQVDAEGIGSSMAGNLGDCSCHDFGYTQVDAEGIGSVPGRESGDCSCHDFGYTQVDAEGIGSVPGRESGRLQLP